MSETGTNGAGPERDPNEPRLEIHDDYVVLAGTRLDRANIGWKEGVKDWRLMWEFIRKRLRVMNAHQAAYENHLDDGWAAFRKLGEKRD